MLCYDKKTFSIIIPLITYVKMATSKTNFGKNAASISTDKIA